MYNGDGTTNAGWPSQAAWISFDDAWSQNLGTISASCTQFLVDNNSEQETANLKNAILSIAQESGVDERFILAIVMQESKGCVRCPTTNFGVNNPGLMQSHDGQGTCNPGTPLAPQPVADCTNELIIQQIRDGTMGTSEGDGLVQSIAKANCDDVSKYYKAARLYNSGPYAELSDLSAGGSTSCYAADVANRLTGWTTSPQLCPSA